MYNGRSCSERTTKQNLAWSKDQLIQECRRLNIPYKSSMTKLQLCQLLIQNTSPSSELDSLIDVPPSEVTSTQVSPKVRSTKLMSTKVLPTKVLPTKVLPTESSTNQSSTNQSSTNQSSTNQSSTNQSSNNQSDAH